MHPDIRSAAEIMKKHVHANTAEALAPLIEFADTYAVTPRLRHEALLLKLNYSNAENSDQQRRLESDIVDLVGRIVEDHQALADTEETRKRREAIQTLRSRYKQVEPPRDVVFACEDLGRTYRKSGFTLAGVTLALRLGTITGVVGENANGKTTLFRLVVGELRHTAGSLGYPLLHPNSERNIDWPKVKSRIAYVPQELPEWRGSLRDNLQYEAALHGVLADDNVRAVDYIVERLGLQDHIQRKWPELSGGFKFRFALARALVWKPKLLALDEPLSNLDFKMQLTVLRDVRDLAKTLRDPMAVLISSQHLHEIEAVSDSIVFLRNGDAVYNGPTSGIGETRRHNTFELGADCEFHTLRRLLNEGDYPDIYYDGVSYVITASLRVTQRDLLERLLHADIQVRYFRDISRSIKQLFD